MTVYKAGDKVTLEHPDGSKLVARKVLNRPSNPAIGVTDNYVQTIGVLTAWGWYVTSHEPAVTLPTEFGVYQSHTGHLFKFGSDGWWQSDTNRYVGVRTIEGHAPFTRLESRVVTAAAVIDWIEKESFEAIGYAEIVRRAREHFGVES